MKKNYNDLLIKLNKKPRINWYISPFTETKISTIDWLGLFANKDLDKDEVVAAWWGHIVTTKEINWLPKEIWFNYALEIYPWFYLAETNSKELDRADFINHSCSPNCKIVNKLIMITKRKIKKWEELTCNFSSKENKWVKVSCKCMSKLCKRFVYF